jgi:hypothetical protein
MLEVVVAKAATLEVSKQVVRKKRAAVAPEVSQEMAEEVSEEDLPKGPLTNS